jgi:large subunit ribosomal protein L23
MAIFSKKEDTGSTKPAATSAASSQSSFGSGIPMALLGPRVSEKAAGMANVGKYVFNVIKATNKVEIKKAVEKAYKVNVIRVNILNTRGKTRNTGRVAGKTSGFKKAIVTLKAGQKIEGATETI